MSRGEWEVIHWHRGKHVFGIVHGAFLASQQLLSRRLWPNPSVKQGVNYKQILVESLWIQGWKKVLLLSTELPWPEISRTIIIVLQKPEFLSAQTLIFLDKVISKRCRQTSISRKVPKELADIASLFSLSEHFFSLIREVIIHVSHILSLICRVTTVPSFDWCH